LQSGLYQYNDSGDKLDHSVTVEVRRRAVGSGTAWASCTLVGTFALTAKLAKTLRYDIVANVTAGQYEVGMKRITADDAEGSKKQSVVTWTAFRSQRTAEPPVDTDVRSKYVFLSLYIKATSQLSGVVSKLNCICESEVPVWNGSTSGPTGWAGTGFSQNPAALYLWALRGGMNPRPIADANIDWARIEALYATCVNKGWTCNAVVASETRLRDMLNKIGSTARSTFTMRDGKYSVVVDEAKTNIVQHFTPRNVKGFSWSKGFADLPYGALINFVSATDGYDSNQRIVPYDGYTEAQAEAKLDEFELWGITDPELVYKHGRYRLAVAKLRPEIMSFETDAEGIVCEPGDLVVVSHDAIVVGHASGRVKSVILDGSNNATGVTTDELLTMAAGQSYGIRFRRSSDGASVYTTITTIAGETNSLSFAVAIPAANRPAIGDLFTFGTAGIETSRSIVAAIESMEDLACKIYVVDEAPGVHTADSGAIPGFNSRVSPPASAAIIDVVDTAEENNKEDPLAAAVADAIALASTTLALSTAAAIRSRAGAVSPGTLTVSARTSLGDAYAGRIAIAVSSDGATYDDEMGIPSDPAGVTYLQDAWADTDGWLVFVGDGTEAVGGGVYTLTPNGTLTYIRTRKALDPTGTTERLRFKKNGQVTAAYYYNGTTYVAMTLIDDGDYYIATAYITTGYSYAYIRFSGPATLTLPIEIDWVYYGTGAYAGYLSASDESSKDYTIPATMLANGMLSYVASIRVRLYAAGGTTTLLGERLCSVSADPSTAASYLGIGILSALGTATFESATVDEDGDITVIGNVNQVYVGDTVINYASTGGVSTLGMYKWSGSAWVKTTTLAELGKAIPDFMGLSKAGISIPDATIVSLLIVQELLAQNATITGGLYIQSGGSIRGGDRYDQDGEIIDEDVSGFFISAGGACKFAGIEFDGEESGGVQWGCPTKVGTDLTLEDIGSPALASLSGTDFAFIDATLNTLRRYRWNGITFGQVGTGIGVGAIAGPALAALNYRDVAFVDSALDELRVYRWGTTEFALLGAGLSLAPMSTPALAAMNGTDVAFIDAYNEVLRLYRWSGSAFSLVGTGLSIPGVTTPALAALNGTDVVFCDGDLDVLRVYRFSGSGWTLLGGISVSGIGLPALAALNGTDVALADGTTDAVRLYRWTGTTFGKIYDAGTSGIGSTSTPAMTALNGTDVVIVDGYSNKLRMYRWPFSISRPYARKLTG